MSQVLKASMSRRTERSENDCRKGAWKVVLSTFGFWEEKKYLGKQWQIRRAPIISWVRRLGEKKQVTPVRASTTFLDFF